MSKINARRNSSWFLLLLIAASFYLSSCSLLNIDRQLAFVDSASEISGEVELTYSNSGAIKVLLFSSDESGIVSLVDEYALTGDGRYSFYTDAGTYLVAAYIGSGEEGTYQEGDHATYYGLESGKPSFITIGEQRKVDAGTLYFRENLRAGGGAFDGEVDVGKMINNIGKRISLDDPIFSTENAASGLWRPLDFIDQIGGGLYLLEAYEPGKIPIVFVHGISGTPASWKAAICKLDSSRFQPWVLYYASGARLEMISNYLLKAVNTLQARYHFAEFYVVAHSMGGLPARSFLLDYYHNQHRANVGLFVTINSPLAGMRSAAKGVDHSPIVVPAWRDLAPDSEFLEGVNGRQLPDDIDYHLMFSYQRGKDSDGVVPLESQIPTGIQAEASRLYGFNASHAGILKKQEFLKQLNQILAESIDRPTDSNNDVMQH